jgi:hypothetical protein
METISFKKVLISYLISSIAIFSMSATFSMMGLLGSTTASVAGTMSNELMVLFHLGVVLFANGILHSLFYYGGLKSSPLIKGIGIGILLGVTYFFLGAFALDAYSITSDPFSLLMGAMGGRVIEYSSGGVVTALVSVSDIHRWGLLRAF